MNTHTASNELRVLDVADVDTVSGAAGKLINMGVFGNLWLDDNGCVIWTQTTFDGKGGWTSTSVGQCPQPK
jgi:hypothetical protein